MIWIVIVLVFFAAAGCWLLWTTYVVKMQVIRNTREIADLLNNLNEKMREGLDEARRRNENRNRGDKKL